MLSLLCYIVLYYNTDKIIQTCYLPLINIEYNDETISTSPFLYFSLNSTSIFMLCLYFYQLSSNIIYSKLINKTSICLSFVYIKYLLDILLNQNMNLIEYELNRTVMWVFTTPLMLKMYCETNNLTLWDIDAHYHILSIIPLIFLFPLKNTWYQLLFTGFLYIPGALFMKRLYFYKNLNFTNIFLLIWTIFLSINIVELTNLSDKIYIHTFYNLADTICKFICNTVITNYNEEIENNRNNMDLQSVNFVSYMIQNIKVFENNNKNLTENCSDLIKSYNNNLLQKIPITNYTLKLDLLKKILPFNLDKNYINSKINANDNMNDNAKKFDDICILFMDIINYTELANKYDSDTIFKLLNNIYNHFDNFIKKYPHLQKIETIGDAYMVVGDIFRNKINKKDVVREIILLALDFLKEIKTIDTPDLMPLCIRIGINMGSVNVGILGNEIPRLCVVGNAVNISSRLQSTSEEDSIQISDNIYEIVKQINFEKEFHYKLKEKVFLKNIGFVCTHIISLFDNKNNN